MVLLILVLAVLWFGRGPIALALPQAELLYARVGIHTLLPPGEGLEIEFGASADDDRLSLEGEIINISNDTRDIPKLYVVISDAHKKRLKTWSFTMETRRLGPGESTFFTSQADEVPANAANVKVFFINPDENP